MKGHMKTIIVMMDAGRGEYPTIWQTDLPSAVRLKEMIEEYRKRGLGESITEFAWYGYRAKVKEIKVDDQAHMKA